MDGTISPVKKKEIDSCSIGVVPAKDPPILKLDNLRLYVYLLSILAFYRSVPHKC